MEQLEKKLNLKIEREKMQGLLGECQINGEKVLLAKPLTYMNLSGNCVSEILHFYKAKKSDLLYNNMV